MMIEEIKVGKYSVPRNCVTLGRGSFSTVVLGHEVDDCKKKVAIKVMLKNKLNSKIWEKELCILQTLQGLNQENLVNLFHFEETDQHVFIVTEFCGGGDLLKYLQVAKVLGQPEIAHFLRHMASALDGLKSLNIVHRDLKPANILMHFNMKEPKKFYDITFKIADFGFAKFLSENMMTATICGSPMYMAPEILTDTPYNYKADLWSIGVITYQCALGKVPFMRKSYVDLVNLFRNNKAQLELPDTLCKELRSLIKGLLVQHAARRIEFDEFFAHSFLRLMPESSVFQKKKLVEERQLQCSRVINKENISTNPSIKKSEVSISMSHCSQLQQQIQQQRHQLQQQQQLLWFYQTQGLDSQESGFKSHFDTYVGQNYVVVEHDMTPEKDLCNVSYGKVTPLKYQEVRQTPIPAPRKSIKLVSSVTQNPINEQEIRPKSREKEIRPLMNNWVRGSGCPVDPESMVREQSCKEPLKRKSQGDGKSLLMATGKPGVTSSRRMNLDEVKTPSISLDLNKRMKTTLSSSPTRNAVDWSCGAESVLRMMSSSIMSMSSVFYDALTDEQFTSPGLNEKILMEKPELELVEKLEFLLKLVQLIIKLAAHGGLWFTPSTSSSPSSSSPQSSSPSWKLALSSIQLSPSMSILSPPPLLWSEDKLALHARCFLIILSSFDTAKSAVKKNEISHSKTLRKIMKDFKKCYNECLTKSRELKVELDEGDIDKPPETPSKSAETILYYIAIEAAREGAKAELAKNFEGSYQCYQVAYIFLHWVELKTKVQTARDAISKYKEKIEKRLKHFQDKGPVPYE